MSVNYYMKLWKKIQEELNQCFEDWEERIKNMGQIAAVETRNNQSRTWSDSDVFRSALLSLLSNQTDWSIIENILNDQDLNEEFNKLFNDFDVKHYADLLSKEEVNTEDYNNELATIYINYVPWFKKNIPGAPYIPRNLCHLVFTAKKFIKWIEDCGSIEANITSLYLQECNQDPKKLAQMLGTEASDYKLKGFGIPLAAELLKNIGFDVAKPDVHINRAIVMWGLWNCNVKWDNKSQEYKSPIFNDEELLKVMQIVEKMAKTVRQNVCFIDNAIWLLCAKSGCHKTNKELGEMLKKL